MKRIFSLIMVLTFTAGMINAQPKIQLVEKAADKKVDVLIDGKLFTSYIYPDNIKKPVLWPVITAEGNEVTRQFPMKKKAGEQVDHPHHIGIWLNYGDVNGLDFWNNSSAIAPEKKSRYGHIRLDSLLSADPDAGELTTLSTWNDHLQNRLMAEKTTYRFSSDASHNRSIERITHLTALQQVTFRSNKEGLFAIRVDRAFEEADEKPARRLDASALPADEPYAYNEGVNGHYRNRQGLEGEAAVWGIKTPWVALRAEIEEEVITLVILDHPQNPSYPGWPHARGYGLFSMNNLAGNTMNPDDAPMEIVLEEGEEITFRHMLIIGGEMTDEMINKKMEQFHIQ